MSLTRKEVTALKKAWKDGRVMFSPDKWICGGLL